VWQRVPSGVAGFLRGAKISGCYDNEYGSYTNLLGDLTIHVHRTLE
jgi:hypothetical protein